MIWLLLLAWLAQSNQTGSLVGRVTNAQTGEPLAGATVRLMALNVQQSAFGQTLATTSGADGGFAFENVAPGVYLLGAEKSGFSAAAADAARPARVMVGAGGRVAGLSIRLDQQGSLGGKVVDENGAPVDAEVQVFGNFNHLAKRRLSSVARTKTNADGEFSFTTLAPGKYYILAEPQKDGLARTLYPKALDLDSAAEVDVAAGQEIGKIDIQARSVASYHIRGRVDGADLAAGATVSLAPGSTFDVSVLGGTARLTKDGTFDLAKVLPGAYTLWVSGISGRGSQQRGSRPVLLCLQEVDVGASDIDGLVLGVNPPINLDGRITMEGIDNFNFSQLGVTLAPSGDSGFGRFQNLQVQVDGSFAAKDVDPGVYTVRVTSIPAGTYLKSTEFNRQDITASGLDVSQGGSGTIAVTLSKGVGEVDGTLRDAGSGKTAVIVLAPEKYAPDGLGFMTSRTNAGGSFTIKNVPPGRYYVYAVDQVTPLWQNPDFLRDMQRQGARIEVEENGREQVEAPAITVDQIQREAAALGLTFP